MARTSNYLSVPSMKNHKIRRYEFVRFQNLRAFTGIFYNAVKYILKDWNRYGNLRMTGALWNVSFVPSKRELKTLRQCIRCIRIRNDS